jgi:hypothetical protein
VEEKAKERRFYEAEWEVKAKMGGFYEAEFGGWGKAG